MNMQTVTSSQIEAVGYDEGSKTLHVRFKGGSTYAYDDVPPHEHADLMAAGSIGAHFGKRIKGGGFAYRKL